MSLTWFCVVLLVAVCQGSRTPRQTHEDSHNYQGQEPKLVRVPLTKNTPTRYAVCTLQPSSGHEVSGTVYFKQETPEGPVEVTGSISGLTPGYHGFHVHQNPDLSNNCKAAGSHFNPENHSHGAPEDTVRHAGDLGNILVDEHGISYVHILDSHISLCEDSPLNINERAIVIHQNPDDLGRGRDAESKKTGNAGARVACCRISALSP